MKGVAIAAAVGAATSTFFYLTVKLGVDMGFRAAAAVSRRREAKRERTAT